MPIYLEGPAQSLRGPDGRGWNRLRLDVIEPAARCALRPLTLRALVGSINTIRASWGGDYDVCMIEGACKTCPLFLRTRPISRRVPGFHPCIKDFYIREDRDGKPHAMNKMERGWDEYSFWGFSWIDVRFWPGFYIDKFGRDQHSEWVLMRRLAPDEAAQKAEAANG